MNETITVAVVDHPQGSLMRIEGPGWSIVLDRDEAFALLEKINDKLGEMGPKV
jgi:hypothetical protein